MKFSPKLFAAAWIASVCLFDLVAGPLTNPPFLPPETIAPIDTELHSDNGGIPDYWERIYGLDPLDPSDDTMDPDADGLTSLEEFLISSANWNLDEEINYQILEPLIKDVGKSLDPTNPDTDGDLASDGWEHIQANRDPRVADASGALGTGGGDVGGPVFVVDFENTPAGVYLDDPLLREEHPISRSSYSYVEGIEGKAGKGFMSFSPENKIFEDGMSLSAWIKPNFSSGTTVNERYTWVSIFDIGKDDAAQEKYDRSYLGVVLQRDTLLLGTHFNDGTGFKERTLNINGGGFSGGTKYREYTPVNLIEGHWYHLVLTYSGSVVQLYVNGVLVIEMDTPKSWVSEYPPSVLTLNQIAKHNDDFFCIFDSYKIYDRVLTQPQIVELLQLDSDGDTLYDYWELNSFSSLTYTDDPNGNPDGDSLLNFEEQSFSHLSSGSLADTDGDGLEDGDESAANFSNLLLTDTDQDGLSDSLEQQLGSDPRNRDTDGDDLDDCFEYDFNLNVTQSEELSLIQRIAPSDYTSALGDWISFQPVSDSIRTVSERGRLFYEFTVPSSGMYVVRLQGVQTNASVSLNNFDYNEIQEFELYVNDQRIGKGSLNVNYGNDQVEVFMTPFIVAGSHNLRIDFFDILDSYPKCEIQEIEILRISGEDANFNNIADWTDSYLNKVNTVKEIEIESIKSPCFIEGLSRYPKNTSITGLYDTSIYHAGSNLWYAYASLDSEELIAPRTAEINKDEIFRVDFNNGLPATTVFVKWKPHNLYKDASNLFIKKGDKIKFTAFDVEEDPATILHVNGLAIDIVSSSQALIYQFDSAGEYLVSATVPGKLIAQTTVTVLEYDFGHEALAVRNNKERIVDFEYLPDSLSIESTGELSVSYSYTEEGTRFRLIQSSFGNENLLVRFENTGEVLANLPISVFETSYSGESSMRILSTDDGIQTLRGRVFARNLPSWIEAELDIFVSGVQFNDGSLNKVFSSEDLNELGIYEYEMLRPAVIRSSACHRTSLSDKNFPITRYGQTDYYSFGTLAH